MPPDSLSLKYASAHANPQGPGDARPTALQIVQDNQLTGKATHTGSNKTALITGCSSGLGVETARALHAAGFDLFLTVRDLSKGREVVKDMQASDTAGKGSIQLLEMHLDSLQSVRQCADSFLSQSQKLNILILNAGVMACPEGQTKDGFEMQFGTNHLAHFLLFQLLKPTLLASSTPDFQSRVVSVSSSGHQASGICFDDLNLKKQGYNKWTAYGQSKTANIYMANEIERRYGSKGLHGLSLHPGGIMTPLARHMAEDDLKAFGTPDKQRKFKSPEQGAATTVWAAVAPDWEGRGGKYLEDCRIAEEVKSKDEWGGYAPHAYDVEAAKKSWHVSLQLVGLPEVGIELE